MSKDPLPHIPAGAPKQGERWRHKGSGGVYSVIGTGYRENDLAHVVVYQNATGVLWVRPLGDFVRKFEFMI